MPSKVDRLAEQLGALGHPARLSILRYVVQGDPEGTPAGEIQAKQLLLLMDTDKSGKVSKKEFLDFMAAEFDRLDSDKSGELDVKELSQSDFT